MGTEDLPESFVAALGEQVQVDFAERGQEPVGVGHRVHIRRIARAGIADLQPVVDQVGERHRHGEQARLDVLEHIPVVADQRHHFDRVRTVRPDHRVVAVFVRAQNRVRVVMHTGQQSLEVGGIGPQVRACELIGSRHLSTHSLRNKVCS